MPVLSFTYDFAVAPALSQVRLLVSDTDSAHPIFGDEEITAMLGLNTQNVYFAAGNLLMTLSGNRARLAGITQLLDVHLTLGEAAKNLLALAKEYIEYAEQSGAFAFAEMVPNAFARRERIWKQFQRQGLGA